jgi:hypothetical protein
MSFLLLGCCFLNCQNYVDSYRFHIDGEVTIICPV